MVTPTLEDQMVVMPIFNPFADNNVMDELQQKSVVNCMYSQSMDLWQ